LPKTSKTFEAEKVGLNISYGTYKLIYKVIYRTCDSNKSDKNLIFLLILLFNSYIFNNYVIWGREAVGFGPYLYLGGQYPKFWFRAPLVDSYHSVVNDLCNVCSFPVFLQTGESYICFCLLVSVICPHSS